MNEDTFEVTMPDGSKWVVPVRVIALNRAKHYAHKFGGDVERSLNEDTMPLFRSDDYEVKDWACNNMDWEDVVLFAQRVEDAPPPDYQEGWVNGKHRVIWKAKALAS